MSEEEEFSYISPGPKRRIEGVWMPKEEYEASQARIAQLEEALTYIAEFEPQMKMTVRGWSREEDVDVDAPMNVTTYAFALGAVQGRARAALSREPSEAPEKEAT